MTESQANNSTCTFNWQDEDRDSFLHWFLPIVLGDVWQDSKRGDALTEVTEKWTKVELSIFVNGVEVNARGMMESLDRNYEHAVARGVEEKIQELDLTKLYQTIDAFQRVAVNELRERAAAIGLELSDEE